MEGQFRIAHVNVDGAGHIGYKPTLSEAKQWADQLQEKSDSRGNPWHYTYIVWGPYGREMYRTRSNARKLALASARRKAVRLVIDNQDA